MPRATIFRVCTWDLRVGSNFFFNYEKVSGVRTNVLTAACCRQQSAHADCCLLQAAVSTFLQSAPFLSSQQSAVSTFCVLWVCMGLRLQWHTMKQGWVSHPACRHRAYFGCRCTRRYQQSRFSNAAGPSRSSSEPAGELAHSMSHPRPVVL